MSTDATCSINSFLLFKTSDFSHPAWGIWKLLPSMGFLSLNLTFITSVCIHSGHLISFCPFVIDKCEEESYLKEKKELTIKYKGYLFPGALI